MNDIDFGFIDGESSLTRRRQRAKLRQDHTILVVITLGAVIAVTLFHFFVLPHLIPTTY